MLFSSCEERFIGGRNNSQRFVLNSPTLPKCLPVEMYTSEALEHGETRKVGSVGVSMILMKRTHCPTRMTWSDLPRALKSRSMRESLK
jgi:hypothetical protein